MKLNTAIAILLAAGSLLTGCVRLPGGLCASESFTADRVQLLVDETWTDSENQRQVDQEIFDAAFQIIDEAEQYILLDLFLVNDFLYKPGPGTRPLSSELTEKLIEKRTQSPDVQIVFITDPVNTVYGSVPSPLFQTLETAGIQVVWTDLNRLRDSNPLFSKPWRLFIKPFGTAPGNTLKNPIGDGHISLRSALKLLNFKANHRKLIVTGKSLLVTSANPHSASSAHWNMGLQIDGSGQAAACASESAILKMSGAEEFQPAGTFMSVTAHAPAVLHLSSEDTVVPPVGTDLRAVRRPSSDGALGESALPLCKLELLTERAIKEKILSLLNAAEPGARIDLTMFYLSDTDIIRALIKTKKRGCSLRVILDPNKDAFGRIKNGIPNRQSAARLVKKGIPVRWANTHGEQCHIKTLYVKQPGQTATLLLGSANYTRRNLDNYNAECDLACTASKNHPALQKARETFDRWWSNPDGRTYTTEYKTYKDTSILKKIKARFMENSGMSSF